MSNGNDLKRTCVQFTYPKCMIMCSNEEEEMKKEEDKKRR